MTRAIAPISKGRETFSERAPGEEARGDRDEGHDEGGPLRAEGVEGAEEHGVGEDEPDDPGEGEPAEAPSLDVKGERDADRRACGEEAG